MPAPGWLHCPQWFGFIKDYDGGTLMECRIHPTLPYATFPGKWSSAPGRAQLGPVPAGSPADWRAGCQLRQEAASWARLWRRTDSGFGRQKAAWVAGAIDAYISRCRLGTSTCCVHFPCMAGASCGAQSIKSSPRAPPCPAEMLAKQRAALEGEVKRYTTGHVVHPGLPHWKNGGGPLPIEEIPGERPLSAACLSVVAVARAGTGWKAAWLATADGCRCCRARAPCTCLLAALPACGSLLNSLPG